MSRPSNLFSRREVLALLAGSAAASGLSSCQVQAPTTQSRTELLDPLFYSSASAIGRSIQRKEISSEEIVRICLQRIEEVNPKLNAVVQIVAERALAEAREADAALARGRLKGPLHGVPMTIKDSLDTAGIVTTAGTKGRERFVPKEDATVVARLREAGAILLGKTNTPELTLAGETDNLIYGRTNNPYDVSRTPGGSSGGAAAIVAAGGSPFDIGSDTGGSIRAPSHYTGIAGIKPTSGRVPRTGHIVGFDDALESLTSLGPMARFVEDLGTILPVVAGPDGRDPAVAPVGWKDPAAVAMRGLRIAVYTDNGEFPAEAEIRQAIESAAARLSEAGARVTETRPEPASRAAELIFDLLLADGGAGIRRRLERAGTTETHRWLAELLAPREELSADDFARRMEEWARFRREMTAFFQDYDAIVSPVVAHVAPVHSQPGDPFEPGTWYTIPYNLTGWPAAVVRVGASSEGLPIGVQIVAHPWREDVALAVGGFLEEALGGWKPPPV